MHTHTNDACMHTHTRHPVKFNPYLFVEEIKRHCNLERKTPKSMKAGTEVDNAICVCAHKVDNLPSAKLGLGHAAHCKSLSVHRGDDGAPHL